MQRRHAEVSGLREQQRALQRLAVADFADHQQVRRLAHRADQRGFVGVGVDAHLALVDDGFLVLEDEFDRVLDGQDVAGLDRVAVVDHRCHRRRLAGAGGADDQDQPELLHDHVLQHIRQPQCFKGRHIGLDEADHHGHGVLLAEDVDAEIPEFPAALGEVHLVPGLELLDLRRRHQLVADLLDLFGVQRLAVDRQHRAVDLDLDRRAGGEEHVRRLLVGHQLEQRCDEHGADPPLCPVISRDAPSGRPHCAATGPFCPVSPALQSGPADAFSRRCAAGR